MPTTHDPLSMRQQWWKLAICPGLQKPVNPTITYIHQNNCGSRRIGDFSYCRGLHQSKRRASVEVREQILLLHWYVLEGLGVPPTRRAHRHPFPCVFVQAYYRTKVYASALAAWSQPPAEKGGADGALWTPSSPLLPFLWLWNWAICQTTNGRASKPTFAFN